MEGGSADDVELKKLSKKSGMNDVVRYYSLDLSYQKKTIGSFDNLVSIKYLETAWEVSRWNTTSSPGSSVIMQPSILHNLLTLGSGSACIKWYFRTCETRTCEWRC
jgi:hypothetical protein